MEQRRQVLDQAVSDDIGAASLNDNTDSKGIVCGVSWFEKIGG